MKPLTAKQLASSRRYVQVMYTTGKFDYVPEYMLKHLQDTKKIAYLV